MTDQDHGSLHLELKQLASQNNLSIDELKTIIAFCGNFFNQDLPQKFGKSFNLPFLVRGFGGKTFRLQKANKIEAQLKLIDEVSQDKTISSEQKKKIIDELNRQKDKTLENSLFLSDLIAFLEQSNLQLAKFLDQDGKQALTKLGRDFFNQIGLSSKISADQILLKELNKLEQSYSLWQKVNTDLAQAMIKIIEQQQEDNLKTKDSQEEIDKKTPTSSTQDKKQAVSSQDAPKEDVDGGDKEEKTEEIKQTLPEDFSSEFNLARLDDRSKLYIRSLAIISINQSLQIQFANLSKEQLTTMGFEQIPNFNQLSLETRQQLLSISFSKIENLFASGRYDLEDLINNPSLRITFSKDVALKTMTDIRGGQLFAIELGEMTKSDKNRAEVQAQLENNQNQALTQEKLAQKLNISATDLPPELQKQLENLSSEEAELFFSKLDSQADIKKDFLKNIKKSFTRVTKKSFLNEWQTIVADDKRAMEKAFFAQENILPIIDTFIQQNYPVDYVESFDWQRFQAYFGQDFISQSTFLANERAIKDLIGSYWRSQRAEWTQSIHEGIANELYKPEDIEKIEAEEVLNSQDKKAIQKRTIYFQQLKQQAQLNAIDADAVTQTLAGFPQSQISSSAFSDNQSQTLEQLRIIYQQSFLDLINSGGHEAQTTTLNYYFPQEEFLVQNIYLQASSLPQFSAYDLGAINYNQAFGPDENGQYPFVRQFNEEGAVESQLQEGFESIKNLANRGIDIVGEKAVRAGLDYLTAGSFEALPEPIKQMIEKIAWGEIKKKLGPLLKILAASILAILAFLGTLLGIIIKLGIQAASFFKNLFSGNAGADAFVNKNLLSNALETGAANSTAPLGSETGQLANRVSASEIQTGSTQLTGARASLAELGSGAMATAGQAVVTAFGLAAGSMLLYQTSVNSAFLTQFPTGGRRGGGGTVIFCNDVVVGNLTYYSQKSYNNIMICNSDCSFGSSSCGPVSISMILNEDPITMSTREGYLVPGGCGATSCAGTSLSPLINTLTSSGISATAVPTPTGSPGQITDELANYLAEGNLLFALTHTRGFGHYYIITCVESPGYLTAYDPWWGENVTHKVVSSSGEGLTSGTNNSYIRHLYLIKN